MVLIVDDISVEIVEPLLPRFVLFKKRIGFVLLDLADSECGIFSRVDDPGVQQKKPVAFRFARIPDGLCITGGRRQVYNTAESDR